MGNKTNKQTIVIKQKIVIEEKKPKKKQSWLKSCFGSKKNKETTKKSQKSIVRQQLRNSYAYDTRKSSIFVKSVGNIDVQDQLFEGREKKLLDIKMRRAQPYQITKNSDYFDSEQDEKNDLAQIKKVYNNCEIANYQTPENQKLKTVVVKTYLFDRNLTKIQA